MGYTIAQKIIKNHLVCGEMTVGSDIGLKIDQTLTQDATGTMAYIEYEAMGIPRVKTEKSVAYIDHNTLQTGFENADDHRFIQSVCKKHGIYFSRPGNGICHQVHLERFGKPGKTLIGSDSHTPTGGGIGMLAIGAGGLDVAVAMGGGAYYITMPKMVRVNLTGKLSPWVSAKDIILAVLRVMSVKGGVGKIVEYGEKVLQHLQFPKEQQSQIWVQSLVLQPLCSRQTKQQESSSRLRAVRKTIQSLRLMMTLFMTKLSKSTFQSLNRLQPVRIHPTMLSQSKSLRARRLIRFVSVHVQTQATLTL